MIAATVLAIFYVPCFFVLVMKHFSKHRHALRASSAENLMIKRPIVISIPVTGRLFVSAGLSAPSGTDPN